MSTEKKRILVLSDWYLPGYRAGGPIRSLANLVAILKHDFFIVTRNTDHHSTEPYKDITPNTWIKQSDNVQVFYMSESAVSAEAFEKIITGLNCDKIYFNSLFSPKFTLMPLRVAAKLGLRERCVLAPRGMLKSGALSVKSNKKKVFLMLAKLSGLYKGIVWHATNAQEEKEIRDHFPKVKNVRIAPNLSAAPGEKSSKPNKQPGQLKLVCIARISPEKGILDALKFLQPIAQHAHIECDFFGTQQNAGYLQECKAFASTIPHAHIRFNGEITPEDIPGILKQYHFFYMPTWGENFGHAIAEALTNATPVIISDKTPWKNLEPIKAGWDLPLVAANFASVLRLCAEMNDSTYQQWSEGAYRHGCKVALDHASIDACYNVFI